MFAFIDVIVTAALNLAVAAAPYIAIGAGMMFLQRQQAKSTQSQQRKEQQAAAEAQAKIAGQRQAIAHAPISPEQMKMVMGQRQIESLAKKFEEQDRTEPEIYTLPSIEPTGTLERVNLLIQEIISK